MEQVSKYVEEVVSVRWLSGPAKTVNLMLTCQASADSG
jgi:hypothetical protein